MANETSGKKAATKNHGSSKTRMIVSFGESKKKSAR
jgi:hypothetical protein